ncbi:MAG TPA: hypothetical protein VMR76_01825 [Candidatus Saccharimonadia bacterium]|nr:hypothetical protein [Candidatus Saccharimonadia bacterium]
MENFFERVKKHEELVDSLEAIDLEIDELISKKESLDQQSSEFPRSFGSVDLTESEPDTLANFLEHALDGEKIKDKARPEYHDKLVELISNITNFAGEAALKVSPVFHSDSFYGYYAFTVFQVPEKPKLGVDDYGLYIPEVKAREVNPWGKPNEFSAGKVELEVSIFKDDDQMKDARGEEYTPTEIIFGIDAIIDFAIKWVENVSFELLEGRGIHYGIGSVDVFSKVFDFLNRNNFLSDEQKIDLMSEANLQLDSLRPEELDAEDGIRAAKARKSYGVKSGMDQETIRAAEIIYRDVALDQMGVHGLVAFWELMHRLAMLPVGDVLPPPEAAIVTEIRNYAQTMAANAEAKPVGRLVSWDEFIKLATELGYTSVFAKQTFRKLNENWPITVGSEQPISYWCLISVKDSRYVNGRVDTFLSPSRTKRFLPMLGDIDFFGEKSLRLLRDIVNNYLPTKKQ